MASLTEASESTSIFDTAILARSSLRKFWSPRRVAHARMHSVARAAESQRRLETNPFACSSNEYRCHPRPPLGVGPIPTARGRIPTFKQQSARS